MAFIICSLVVWGLQGGGPAGIYYQKNRKVFVRLSGNKSSEGRVHLDVEGPRTESAHRYQSELMWEESVWEENYCLDQCMTYD